MKPWAQVETDPEFTSAPVAVKREVRNAHLQGLEQDPNFQSLSPEEKASVRAHVQGGYPTAIQTAGHLIAASLTGEVEKALLEDDQEGLVQTLLDAATAAEKNLDVPLKDRKREKFPDLAHYHIEKPLRALLCFIEEGLPEYQAYKLWLTRQGMPWTQIVQDAIAHGNDPAAQSLPVGKEEVPSNSPKPSVSKLSDLVSVLRQSLPGLNQDGAEAIAAGQPVPPVVMEMLIRANPEAALKSRIPFSQWTSLDRRVLEAVALSLKGAGDRLGSEATQLSVSATIQAVTHLAYETVARSKIKPPISIPKAQRPFPIDPGAIGEYILASAAAGPEGMSLARQFPAVYLVLAGLVDVPPNAQGPLAGALGTIRANLNIPQNAPVDVARLASGIRVGAVNLIVLSGLNRQILEAAATRPGVPMEFANKYVMDVGVACQEPALVALLSVSEAQAKAEFAKARENAMKKVGEEAHKAINPPQASPEPAKPQPPALPGPTPLRQALRARPIDMGSLKDMGLWADFEPYAVAQENGTPLPQELAFFTAQGLLPQGASPMDLLDALDAEQKGALQEAA